MRNIDDILHFRSDFSPFLVHLTRNLGGILAKQVLENIIREKMLIGNEFLSDARFGMYTKDIGDDDKKLLFGAICFTETPLNEVHCLLEIDNRNIDLQPYGLVFRKERLVNRGVSPVFYINNKKNDKDLVFQALCGIVEKYPDQAKQILPLISVFGYKIKGPFAKAPEGEIDFRWEREWRYPYIEGPFNFDVDDVFIGLCPHDEINYFEELFQPVAFIDPYRNMKWYATKLIDARQRLDMKNSVV